jgi:hypothetical protein
MNDTNNPFLGSWELESWSAERPTGEIVFPYGTDPIGRISYDANGQMAVQIMKNHRSKFHSEDPLQSEVHEAVAAYHDFMAYCGYYNVNAESNQVVHKITISSFPNWIGQNQVRNYKFSNRKLILTTDPIGTLCHKLVWNNQA